MSDKAMNHLIQPLLKKFQEKGLFGTVTLKYQAGKVVHVNVDQALKEQEIQNILVS